MWALFIKIRFTMLVSIILNLRTVSLVIDKYMQVFFKE